FLPPAELRGQWQEALAGTPAEDVVTMCGSGVTACHNLLALEVAGLPGARLYAGSWSEWIRDPARPIARGPASDVLRCSLSRKRFLISSGPDGRRPQVRRKRQAEVQSRATLAGRGFARPLQRERVGQGVLLDQRCRPRGRAPGYAGGHRQGHR